MSGACGALGASGGEWGLPGASAERSSWGTRPALEEQLASDSTPGAHAVSMLAWGGPDPRAANTESAAAGLGAA